MLRPSTSQPPVTRVAFVAALIAALLLPAPMADAAGRGGGRSSGGGGGRAFSGGGGGRSSFGGSSRSFSGGSSRSFSGGSSRSFSGGSSRSFSGGSRSVAPRSSSSFGSGRSSGGRSYSPPASSRSTRSYSPPTSRSSSPPAGRTYTPSYGGRSTGSPSTSSRSSSFGGSTGSRSSSFGSSGRSIGTDARQGSTIRSEQLGRSIDVDTFSRNQTSSRGSSTLPSSGRNSGLSLTPRSSSSVDAGRSLRGNPSTGLSSGSGPSRTALGNPMSADRFRSAQPSSADSYSRSSTRSPTAGSDGRSASSLTGSSPSRAGGRTGDIADGRNVGDGRNTSATNPRGGESGRSIAGSTARGNTLGRQLSDSVNRPGRGKLRDPSKNQKGDIDDFFDDVDDHWDDFKDDLHDHWGHNNWFNNWHFGHAGLFPYFFPSFYLYNPFFHYYGWYHYWFGYYPIYSHYYWPSYVTYQPVYVPSYSRSTVIYSPTYTLPAEGAPLQNAPQIPTALANELQQLGENQDAVASLEDGALQLKEGSYLAAADSFRAAMAAEPNNAVPKFALAHALFALGDYEYAAFLVRRGMELLPDWPRVGTSLHELYGKPDDLKEHTIALATYTDAHQDSADARFLLGYVEYFSGNLDGAEAAFRAVESSNPYRADVTTFLSRIAEIRIELQRQAEQGR